MNTEFKNALGDVESKLGGVHHEIDKAFKSLRREIRILIAVVTVSMAVAVYLVAKKYR